MSASCLLSILCLQKCTVSQGAAIVNEEQEKEQTQDRSKIQAF